MTESEKKGPRDPEDETAEATSGDVETPETEAGEPDEATPETGDTADDPADAQAEAGEPDRSEDDVSDETPSGDATEAETEEVAEASDSDDDPADADPAAPDEDDETEAAASFQTGADDGEAPLSDEEQREIAEAALRDAERGYNQQDDAAYAAEPGKPIGEPAAESPAAESATPAPAAEPAASPPPPASSPAPAEPAREVVVEKRSGVLPGFIGGVAAVAGAVFAAPYVLPENMRPVMSLAPVEASLGEQTDRINTLVERLDTAEATLAAAATAESVTAGDTQLSEEIAGFDARVAAFDTRVAAFEDRVAELTDEIAARISNETAGLTGRLDALAADMAELERSPIEDSTDPAVIAALEAFRGEMARVRDEVAAQTAENTRVIEEAAEMTAEARALAEAEAEAAAVRAAQAAQMQALADIKTALEDGLPYGDALSALVVEVPEALNAGQGGVATLGALQAGFTAPARGALDAARRADVGDAPAERGLTFLQTQLGMRSLAPRDGDSADAILSRAEAATQNGDLAAAVTELQALPEPALAAMQDWIARATIRAEALAAADALAQSMATN